MRSAIDSAAGTLPAPSLSPPMAGARPGRRVLLVDDSDDDLELAMLTLRTLPDRPEVLVARDGVEALEVLRAAGRPPGLVLLDLQMPRLDGAGVLRERRADEALRRIPVVVFSTSAADWDVERSYDLGANAYLVKPAEVDHLERVLGDVLRVFLDHVVPPGGRGAGQA